MRFGEGDESGTEATKSLMYGLRVDLYEGKSFRAPFIGSITTETLDARGTGSNSSEKPKPILAHICKSLGLQLLRIFFLILQDLEI